MIARAADRERRTPATRITLDDKLVAEAVRLGKHRTKKAAVTTALTQYVGRLGILDLMGKIDFDPTYDYKAARRAEALPPLPSRLRRDKRAVISSRSRQPYKGAKR